MKKLSILFVLSIFLYSMDAFSLVTAGGYVPFGPSTQRTASGSSNTLSFDPMLGVNTKIVTPWFDQIFLPELDLVFHTGEKDGYSKRTYLLTADFGYEINSILMLRYGTSTAITQISGDGGVVKLNNGNSTDSFYQPDKSNVSWNQTLNLGIDGLINSCYSVRFETYIFNLFHSKSRQASYALSFIYYMF